MVLVALLLLVAGCSEAPLDAVGLPSRALADGLLAHWRLDDRSGSVVSDGSGNGHSGELSGGAWIAPGRFGGALRLSGGEDAVAVPGFPAPTPAWTVALWIRLSDEQLAANVDTFTTILSTENLHSGGWEVNIDQRLSQPRFVFDYWSPPLMDYEGAECSCVETGVWLNLAGVIDVENERILLYRNGILVDQETWPSDVVPGDATLHFGRWNMGGRVLSGDLDDVAIWGRALTAEEVAAFATHSL